jgi:predicted outer membrane protein
MGNNFKNWNDVGNHPKKSECRENRNKGKKMSKHKHKLDEDLRNAVQTSGVRSDPSCSMLQHTSHQHEKNKKESP